MKVITPSKPFQAFIDRLIAYLQPHMNLSEFMVRVRYVDVIPEAKSMRHVPDFEEGGGKGYAMQVQSDLVYLEILVTISNRAYYQYRRHRSRVALALIHEFAHIYTDEFYDTLWDLLPRKKYTREWLRKVGESNTERIARTIFALIPPDIWRRP